MVSPENPIKIGQISFTNAWPVFHYFPADKLGAWIELTRQIPSELNRLMATGQIDIAAISSFAYAENTDKYVLLPNLSVSSNGKVGSILLFHKKPLTELGEARIALPTTSATSINLLKILLQRFYNCYPQYTIAQPDLTTMMQNADAALLIGDDAIRASWMNHSYEVTDLGELWKRHTGCSMVYAVWAVRRETAHHLHEYVNRIHEAFLLSKHQGQVQMLAYAQIAMAQIGGSLSFWKQYFANLNHDFGSEHERGLSLYYQYAFEQGLLANSVPIQLWDYKKVV